MVDFFLNFCFFFLNFLNLEPNHLVIGVPKALLFFLRLHDRAHHFTGKSDNFVSQKVERICYWPISKRLDFAELEILISRKVAAEKVSFALCLLPINEFFVVHTQTQIYFLVLIWVFVVNFDSSDALVHQLAAVLEIQNFFTFFLQLAFFEQGNQVVVRDGRFQHSLCIFHLRVLEFLKPSRSFF